MGYYSSFIEDTVGLIIWSGVEMAVTMVCIGIPILRPLYRQVVHGYVSSAGAESHKQYQKQNESNGPHQSYEMGSMAGRLGGKPRSGKDRMSKLGLHGQTMTDIQTANGSDEHILYPQAARSHDMSMGPTAQPGRILVKDDIKVEWNDN